MVHTNFYIVKTDSFLKLYNIAWNKLSFENHKSRKKNSLIVGNIFSLGNV